MRNIIVMGASAGGIPAIKQVIRQLPADIDAAIVIVIHVSPKSDSAVIANSFQKSTVLTCKEAADMMPLERGCIYVAPADHHLMIKGYNLRTNRGPHENKYRPSVDVLFRSAAVEFGHKAIGVILTGMLEDGTSGMSAIKRSGGICIVQDPIDAEFPDMPQSVLNNVVVDYVGTLDELPDIIGGVMKKPLPPHKIVPNELQIEADITEKMMSDIDKLKTIAGRSDFICPDCGGGLWAIKNDPVHRYRCHTGHVYTEKLLFELQEEKIEESIWVAIRLLEEKSNLMMLMNSRRSTAGKEPSFIYQARIEEINKHIDRLKNFLILLRDDFDKTNTAP
jgi:two-component system, chemotaxis family, protein-glutamate methylesterase/glutaminase